MTEPISPYVEMTEQISPHVEMTEQYFSFPKIRLFHN
jgi:hypothetical protein